MTPGVGVRHAVLDAADVGDLVSHVDDAGCAEPRPIQCAQRLLVDQGSGKLHPQQENIDQFDNGRSVYNVRDK